MENILVSLMSQLTTLTSEEAKSIEESFPVKTFKKGHYLLRTGQIAKDAYHVVSGCIRNYELKDGEEKTWDLYTEDQTAANFQSLASGTPSKVNLVCIEETTVAIVNSAKEQSLYAKHPRFEAFCRSGLEQMMGNQQADMANFIKSSPEERYLSLLEIRPTLVNRVPQHQLASYLGIKPETLSRIRKRIFEKRA